MKIGFLFAGQGTQSAGMGKELYDTYSEAKEVFDSVKMCIRDRLIIDGVKTNIEFHYLTLHNKTFIEGNYDTGFFDRFIKELEEQSGELI